MKRLGRLMAGRRDGLGLSLREMASRCGLSNPYLCQLETGKASNPTILAAIAISESYGISMADIVSATIEDRRIDA